MLLLLVSNICCYWCVFMSSFYCLRAATAPSAPPSFAFDLAQVAEQHVELRWSDLSFLNSRRPSTLEVFLQYQEEDESLQCAEDRGVKKCVRVLISLSSRGVTVAGLSPGSVYSFTLRAAHPSGATWSLGQTRTAYTSESVSQFSPQVIHMKTCFATYSVGCCCFLSLKGPPSPQNITAGPTTVSQIKVHWVLPGAQLRAGWTFVVHYEDVDTGQQRILGAASDSGISGQRQYTAVIGGLRAHRKYRIEVFTVARHGIPSCEQQPVTVRTGEQKAPHLVVGMLFCHAEVHPVTLMTVSFPLIYPGKL